MFSNQSSCVNVHALFGWNVSVAEERLMMEIFLGEWLFIRHKLLRNIEG
jgi:hypothetical protein